MHHAMRRQDWIRLLSLGGIWGMSFIFLRIISPKLGPIWTAELRTLLAGLALAAVCVVFRQRLDWSTRWRQYLVVGLLNSAAPFALFAFAALTLPAAYMAILNATAPMFGTLFGVALLGERPGVGNLLGLVIGGIGVGLVVGLGSLPLTGAVVLALCCGLLAAVCYGLNGAFTKRFVKGASPLAIACASQLCGAALLLPLLPLFPLRVPLADAFTPGVIASVLGISLVCSALAYLLYYRLIADVGPGRALSVTFLIPVFAACWGLFLGETIGIKSLIGGGIVLLGTLLAVRGKKPVPTAR
jgi:drug/metabolite transporter (DMT)-like permease